MRALIAPSILLSLLCAGIASRVDAQIGFAAIFSTLVLGRMSDIIPRKNILTAIYLIRGLGFFALVMVGTQWELYAAATIGGIVWAGSIDLSSPILADLYGVRLVRSEAPRVGKGCVSTCRSRGSPYQ